MTQTSDAGRLCKAGTIFEHLDTRSDLDCANCISKIVVMSYESNPINCPQLVKNTRLKW